MKKATCKTLGGRPLCIKGGKKRSSGNKATLALGTRYAPFDEIKHLMSGVPLRPPLR